jgi:hypothetical protein
MLKNDRATVRFAIGVFVFCEAIALLTLVYFKLYR